ncbi:MAG: tail fiber protein [Sulfuricurvum sp.]
MDEGYVGEVRMFAGTYAPVNWALCNGQLLSIMQYQALYSILGMSYGGDAHTTFGLPNLAGHPVVGSGHPINYIICLNGNYPTRD